ncbi:hypothetical protein ACX3O0_06365 [Homoserinimonas sp. A447]
MFLLIWRRWGWIAILFPVFGFVLWLAIGAGIRSAMHIDAIQGVWNLIALVIGFGIAGIASWVVAVRFIEPVLDDPSKNLPRSTLFFLPVRYWAFVTVAVGLALLVPNAIEIFTTT